MPNNKILSPVAIITVLALALLFSGCGSTDSEENGSNDPVATFDSGEIAPDGTYSYTFNDEETVEYYCKIHSPDMQGQITVTSSVEAMDKDTVLMENSQFKPSDLSVAPSTEVVWINRDNVSHTVTSGNPSSNDDGGGY